MPQNATTPGEQVPSTPSKLLSREEKVIQPPGNSHGMCPRWYFQPDSDFQQTQEVTGSAAGSGLQPPRRFVTHLPPLPKTAKETSLSRSQRCNRRQKLDQFAVQMGTLAGHSARASCISQRALSPRSLFIFSIAARSGFPKQLRERGNTKRMQTAR